MKREIFAFKATFTLVKKNKNIAALKYFQNHYLHDEKQKLFYKSSNLKI